MAQFPHMNDQEVGAMVFDTVGVDSVAGNAGASARVLSDLSAAPVANDSLRGKVALVTGAGGGIGAAICTEFEALGASVIRVDRDGQDCRTYDLSSEDASRAMVEMS